MHMLKVELEGLTTSFRYPHFMAGRHPTFPMPPPATLYGQICSAVGDWVDPKGLEFGYVFTHEGIAQDIEHCHILEVSKSRRNFEWQEAEYPANIEGVVNPFRRDFFFRPRLTLYLNRPDWLEHFRSPRYAVVLGRSQDLATYTRVTVVELQQSEQAYYEHTLLPYDEWRTRIGRGVSLVMPRFLDYYHKREPQFERYIALQERVHTNGEAVLHYEGQSLRHWIDPETPEWQGVQRGVALHRFVEEG